MGKKIIYVDFIKKRKINFLTFILNRILSYINLKVFSKCVSNKNNYIVNNNTKIDYYKFKW